MKTVTTDQLEKLAQRYGYSRHWVEKAIHERLIPPAVKIEYRGHRKGTRPLYNWRTFTGLGALCRLTNLGYRGDELRFSLWYMGVAEWRNDIQDYLKSVVLHYPEQVKSEAYGLLKQRQRDYPRSVENIDRLSEKGQQQVRDAIRLKWDIHWDEITNALLSLAKSGQISPSSNRIDLSDDISTAIENYLEIGQFTQPSSLSPLSMFFSQQILTELIDTSDEKEYRMARVLARGPRMIDKPLPEHLKRIFEEWYSHYRGTGWIKTNRALLVFLNTAWETIYTRMTVHQKQRLGPYRHPGLANRAWLFILTLYVIHQTVRDLSEGS